jgi:2-methylcitrate dehydratase PrpD
MTAPLQELAAFVARGQLADIPPDVVARGRLVLADSLGCIVAGNAAPPVRRLLALEQARDGTQRATVFGTKARLPAESAAFVNGTAGTWHDLDEGNLHTRGHAMIQIAPAAFAEAEAAGLSGSALLEASILGYEAASRIWRATKVRLAVHPHETFGPMAAAFAISKLRGDSAEQMAEAVSIAAGLGVVASRQTLGDGATIRNVYTGHSSRAGFLALDLRDAGFTGEDDAARSVFGGIYGDGFDPAMALDGLGETWWLRKSYFKRFASARYVHGALDATEALITRLGPRLTPETIGRIDIATYFMAATMAQQTVRTTFGTRFSIPFAVASLIARGPEPLTDDGAAAFADPAAHALATRIFVTEDQALTASYPAKQPAVVTLRLTDGSIETQTAEIILGESDNPFEPHVLREKFMALTGNASDAWDRLTHLEAEPNLVRLAADLHGASGT